MVQITVGNPRTQLQHVGFKYLNDIGHKNRAEIWTIDHGTSLVYVQQEQAGLIVGFGKRGKKTENDHEHQVLKGGNFEIYYNKIFFALHPG